MDKHILDRNETLLLLVGKVLFPFGGKGLFSSDVPEAAIASHCSTVYSSKLCPNAAGSCASDPSFGGIK
jgi:hypothetical protein